MKLTTEEAAKNMRPFDRVHPHHENKSIDDFKKEILAIHSLCERIKNLDKKIKDMEKAFNAIENKYE